MPRPRPPKHCRGTIPSANIIATNREPLGAEGEHIYPVPALAVPEGDGDHAADPLEYGAIRLFVERARAEEPRFMPDEQQIAIVSTICRRLDGIPLAIELAAARVAALGIEQLAGRLDEGFKLSSGGRQPRYRAIKRCGRRSTGAMSCSPGQNGCFCAVSRYCRPVQPGRRLRGRGMSRLPRVRRQCLR